MPIADALVELKLDTLRVDESNQTVAVGACIAFDRRMSWKLCTFGLRNIEDVSIAKADEHRTVLLGAVLFGFFLWLAPYANNRRQDAGTALTLLDLAAKPVPRIETSHAGGVRPLPRDLQNVAETLCSRSNYVESVHVEQPEDA
jgi:hypothetical protein